jgi:hypothetical protein
LALVAPIGRFESDAGLQYREVGDDGGRVYRGGGESVGRGVAVGVPWQGVRVMTPQEQSDALWASMTKGMTRTVDAEGRVWWTGTQAGVGK